MFIQFVKVGGLAIDALNVALMDLGSDRFSSWSLHTLYFHDLQSKHFMTW